MIQKHYHKINIRLPTTILRRWYQKRYQNSVMAYSVCWKQ